MKITVKQGDIAAAKVDALIINLFQGVTQPAGGTGAVDKALDGILSQELKRTIKSGFKGKLGETLVLPTYGRLASPYVIIVGLGKSEKMTAATLRQASAAAVRACLKLKIQTVATLLHGAGIGGHPVQSAARLLAEGSYLANYQFQLRKGKKNTSKKTTSEGDEPDKSKTLESLIIVELDKNRIGQIELGLEQGKAVAEGTMIARDWVNDSPNYVTPTFLKQSAEQIPGLKCEVMSGEAIAKAGMGAFAAVAMGSVEKPHLIHLSYVPKKKATKTITLVGKGITFDSGGLSLKPSASMETMKMDMAGAAAVIATMKTLATLNDLSIEVHAFVPTCENMPSGHATRPGDIVTALNGKTIEINNTDAEGRLILADALVYAQQKVKSDLIIDLATLTGACIVALGKLVAGAMGTDETALVDIKKAGEVAGEKFWPLPLFEEYESFLKSDIADLINSGAKGEAGSSAGGMFLKEFIEPKQNWIHLDIAGPAWSSSEKYEIPKGGTGFGVRTLLYYLYGWS